MVNPTRMVEYKYQLVFGNSFQSYNLSCFVYKSLIDCSTKFVKANEGLEFGLKVFFMYVTSNHRYYNANNSFISRRERYRKDPT